MLFCVACLSTILHFSHRYNPHVLSNNSNNNTINSNSKSDSSNSNTSSNSNNDNKHTNTTTNDDNDNNNHDKFSRLGPRHRVCPHVLHREEAEERRRYGV